MPKGHSCRRRKSIDVRIAAFLVFLAATGIAHAKQSDSSQPVLVKADNSVMDQDKEIATLTGHVKLDQGTMHVDGDKAVGHFDQNNQIQRAVTTGSPANFHQTLDDNTLVHGSAANIDYSVSDNLVTLTGNAVVVHEGQGEYHGAKLTYNTDTGQIVGEGGAGGQVHMILQPKKKTAPASKPAAATSAPAIPAKSASVTPPPVPAASAPASASSTH
jgi:lipopolysaccharide export system protein LptA